MIVKRFKNRDAGKRQLLSEEYREEYAARVRRACPNAVDVRVLYSNGPYAEVWEPQDEGPPAARIVRLRDAV